MTQFVDFTVVIPSRYASTRLPGKPLIDLEGKSMIQRVAEQALASSASRVVVATDDQRIVDSLSGVDVEVALTSPGLQSGTDRVWAAVSQKALNANAVIVNVQGDEPLLPPEVIDQAAHLVAANDMCGVATLCEPMTTMADVFNPNMVKVVVDHDDCALYFSRAPIPWDRDRFDGDSPTGKADGWFRHLGIYAFEHWALKRFVELPPSRLEQLESLEQLRLLENGIRIAVAESAAPIPGGVDTPEDADRVRAHLRQQTD